MDTSPHVGLLCKLSVLLPFFEVQYSLSVALTLSIDAKVRPLSMFYVSPFLSSFRVSLFLARCI